MRGIILLTFVFALFISTPAAAQEMEPAASYGICLQAVGHADALYIRAIPVEPGYYHLVVNNYGLGLVEKGSGTLTVEGGDAWFAITMTADYGFDGPTGTHVVLHIPLSTGYGTWRYTYLNPSGGTVFSHAGTIDANMWLCSKPLSVFESESLTLNSAGGR